MVEYLARVIKSLANMDKLNYSDTIKSFAVNHGITQKH